MHEITQPSPDWEKLKSLGWFTKFDEEKQAWVFDEEFWKSIEEVRKFISKKRDKTTLYYPGARFDIPIPLALFDPTTLVFLDPDYGEPSVIQDVILTLEKIVGKQYEIHEKTDASQPLSITFHWNNKDRTLLLYTGDATSDLPESISNQSADYLLLKNTYGGENDLYNNEAVKKMTEGLNDTSYIVSVGWLHDPEKQAEQYGFENHTSFEVKDNEFYSAIDVYSHKT